MKNFFLKNSISLGSPKKKNFQPRDIEIDFLIDSGAESIINKVNTWNKKNYYLLNLPFSKFSAI